MFLLVPAYPGCPGSKAVKRSLLLFVVVEDIERSLNSLKSGKAPGIDKISKEHIMFSHPAVFVHVLCLFYCLQCFDVVGWAAGRASGL